MFKPFSMSPQAVDIISKCWKVQVHGHSTQTAKKEKKYFPLFFLKWIILALRTELLVEDNFWSF